MNQPNQPDIAETTEVMPNALHFSDALNPTIQGDSVDSLVVQGIRHIRETGEEIKARAGDAIQSYGVNYILTNSRNRLHNLRETTARRYLARELLAYFKGSLKVEDGLASASSFWNKIANENGEVNSNYGFYVFHQPIPENSEGARNQYEWVVNLLDRNLKTRRATININQINHKADTLDFPCTIAIQFFTRGDYLCCEVSSRSTDVITGLPYDMGFFSLLTELVYADLVQRGHQNLRLGHTTMKTTFTQIYSSRNGIAKSIEEKPQEATTTIQMPVIEDARLFLQDIYEGTHESSIMRWIHENAE